VATVSVLARELYVGPMRHHAEQAQGAGTIARHGIGPWSPDHRRHVTRIRLVLPIGIGWCHIEMETQFVGRGGTVVRAHGRILAPARGPCADRRFCKPKYAGTLQAHLPQEIIHAGFSPAVRLLWFGRLPVCDHPASMMHSQD
jgi:hypothetical protein